MLNADLKTGITSAKCLKNWLARHQENINTQWMHIKKVPYL
jgi:hypothetical protein